MTRLLHAFLCPFRSFCRTRVVALGGLFLLLAGPATAQRYSVHEAGLDGGGGVVTTGALTLSSSLASSPAGRGSTGRYVLYSGMPSPFAGRAALLVIHDPGDEGAAQAGQDRTITVRIVTNNAPLASVTLFYRVGTAVEPEAVTMQPAGDGFSATIPGTALGAGGLTYYLLVTDENGATARAPRSGVYSLPVRVGDADLRRSEPQPGGRTQAAYRLLSVPIVLDDPRPEAVLGDEIPTLASASAYDPATARLFEPIGTRVAEFPGTGSFELGRAFWLIVQDEVEAIDAGAGTVGALDAPVDIPLTQGWNFVGTPFTLPVPVANVTTADGAAVTLRSYGEDGYNTPDDPVTEMVPFAGYAVFAETASTLVVQPPILSTERAKQASKLAASSAASSAFQWHLRVRGSSRTGWDADNVAAVHTEASAEWDEHDWPEPPSLGSGLSLSFDAPEGAPSDIAFSADVRHPAPRGTTWALTLQSDAKGPIQLAVDGMEHVPGGFEAWLLDVTTMSTWNLRREPQVRVHALTEDMERSLRLVVGTSAYVREVLRDLEALPADFALAPPYPNPSTGPVAFRLSLPEAEQVTVAVYTLLGQRLAILKNREPMEAGIHTVVWEPPRLASGMYFVRMEAGPYRSTQKLVRVR